mgnify:CR=1 FL=1
MTTPYPASATTGATGTQVAGDLPLRAIETGLLPLAGASRYYDWRGTADFDSLPSSYGANLPVQVVSPHPDAASFRTSITWLWSNQGAAERVLELGRRGAKLFVCAYGCQRRRLPITDKATYCGLVVLTDRRFAEWATVAWPSLADAVLAAIAPATDPAGSDGGQ